MSATRMDKPGRLMTRRRPSRSAGRSCACNRLRMTERGDINQSGVSGLTGHTASSPCKGSRMIPLAKLEAARLGLPGRTTMVGNRMLRASTNPLRA